MDGSLWILVVLDVFDLLYYVSLLLTCLLSGFIAFCLLRVAVGLCIGWSEKDT